MKSENFTQILTKEVFLVDFHGCSGTAVESINLGTVRVWLHAYPTWVLDSPVPLSVALEDISEDKLVQVAVYVGVTLHCFIVRFNSGEPYAVKKLYFLFFVCTINLWLNLKYRIVTLKKAGTS